MDKNKTVVFGVDNGVSSNGVAVYDCGLWQLHKLPVKRCRNYQQEESYLKRIDVPKLRAIVRKYAESNEKTVYAFLERPMVNSTRMSASLSAVRCYEAWLIVLEEFPIKVETIDSKHWQSKYLPGVKGTEELKKASYELAVRNWPGLSIVNDGDGLFIAQYGLSLLEKASS